MPPMTGRVIAGRYNLQHPIGRGAMGVVWRARDQILDREVAVKEVVISSLIGEEERRNAYQRTLREARTAARLSHRGLVAVYDVAEEDGRPWIVMELVPSRSLDQVLTVEGRLQPLRVARIGQQLLSALAAAHIAGVLHRDVKPSNVLIATDRTGTGWDERAVLTDFGIAQFEGDPRLTQTGMVMGSPGFTAPERIRGGDATSASDLWSLGATLFAAVEGRGPYEQRGGAITTMSAIINEDAPVAAHAGRLAPVIGALLRRDPATRPTAPAAARMFAFVLPLLSAAEPDPPAAPHPPTLTSQVQSTADGPAATTPEDRAPAKARPAGRSAEAERSPAPPSPTPMPSAAGAAAPDPDQTAERAGRAEAPAAEGASDVSAPESVGEAEAAGAAEADEASHPGAARRAVSTPAADVEAPAEAAAPAESAASPGGDAGEAPDTAAGSADEAASADDAVSADEAVSAVEAASAVSAPQPPAGLDDPDVPVLAGAAAEEPDRRKAGDAPPRAGDTVIDPGPTGLRSEPKPRPAPTFTAAKPGERAAAPTFSAARPDQPGALQRTSQAAQGAAPSAPAPSAPAPSSPPPYWGAPQAPAAPLDGGAALPHVAYSGAAGYAGGAGSAPSVGGQYAGPSQPYPDLAEQYPPAPAGQRRRSRWWLVLVICILVAAAIGAGAALALRHNNTNTNAGGTKTKTVGHAATTTGFQSVDALNRPSTVVPKGWTPETVTPSTYGTTAGFTIDVPPGWIRKPNGLATYFYGPDQMVLDIDLTTHTFLGNMVREAQYIEKQQRPPIGDALLGYHRIVLREVPVRDTRGAFWQFTRSLKGVTIFTDDILFVLPTSAGEQSYAVYIRAPKNGWGSKYLPIFDQILPTFQPVTTS